MGKKKRDTKQNGWFAEFLTSTITPGIPPSVIKMIYISTFLLLTVGLASLYFSEVEYVYIAIFLFLLIGFFLSLTWFLSEYNQIKKKHKEI